MRFRKRAIYILNKKFDHRWNLRQRSGRRGRSLSMVNVIKKRGCIARATRMPTTNASAVLQIATSPELCTLPAIPTTNWSFATFVQFSSCFTGVSRKARTSSTMKTNLQWRIKGLCQATQEALGKRSSKTSKCFLLQPTGTPSRVL